MRLSRFPKDPAAASLVAIVLTGLAAGLVFGLWPALDLKISGLFYDAAQRRWPWMYDPTLQAIRDMNEFVTRAIAVAGLTALILYVSGARSLAFLSPRVALFLLATLAVGPGLIANLALKSHWGRPRPNAVAAFGGTLDFAPWWRPGGGCDTNCSFVSGEAASAFWLLAIAVVLPPRSRAPAVVAALVYGLSMSLVRIAMGGHFPSDTLFAGVFTALAVWLVHGAFFRWRRAADGPPRASGWE